MDGLDHDTKEGIAKFLTSLEGLNKLIDERRAAGYERRERLNEFYVLGRLCLETCGNYTMRLQGGNGIILKERFPQIPDVLTRDELWKYIKEHGVAGENISIVHSTSDAIPPAGVVCPRCSQSWTIKNFHDVYCEDFYEEVNLGHFIGKTSRDFKEFYAKLRDGVYRVTSSFFIRNNRFIDLTPRPDCKDLVKNEHGWVGTKEGIADDYVIQAEDKASLTVWRFYHKLCHHRQLSEDTEKDFYDIFVKAGFENVRMSATQNQYCQCEDCNPWFNINTTLGIILVGWQAWVMNIDWSGTGLGLPESLKKEGVTMGNNFIHARCEEKAIEYLIEIRKELERKQ